MLTQIERDDLRHRLLCCPFKQLLELLAQAQTESGYEEKDIEAALREKIDLPLFNNGTIVKLDFPSDTPTRVRERVVQIHAEVCKSWGCDPSWDRDPKA